MFLNKIANRIANKFYHDSDIIFGLLIVLSGSLLLILGFKIKSDGVKQVSSVLILSALSFFILRNKFHSSLNLSTEKKISNSKNTFLITSIIFYSLLICSMLIINQEIYSRPLSFIIIISLLAGIIASQIILTNNKTNYHLILLEIIILGIIIRASVFFQFADMVGGDPNAHFRALSLILKTGYITSQNLIAYYNFPIMFYFLVNVVKFTGLTIKSAMFVVGICELLSFLFIFLIVKRIFNFKIALLSFLLLAMSTYTIQLGFLIIPQSFGIAIFSISIYLFFIQNELDRYKGAVYTVFILLFLSLNILSHTINAFATLITLLSIFLLDLFKLRISKFLKIDSQIMTTINWTLIGFFFIFLLYYWMFSSGMMGVIGESIKWGLSSSEQAPSVSTIAESFTTTVFKQLPIYLTAFLAIIGTLYSFNIKSFKTITLYGWLVIFFVFISVFLSLNSFLPARWFVYAQICLIVPVTLTIFKLSQISRKKVLSIFLVIFILSFVSLINNESTAESINPFTPGVTQGMKYSEINVGILDKIPSDIKVYADLGYHYPNQIFWDGSNILTGEDPLDGIILVRKDIESKPFFSSSLGGGHYSSTGLGKLFLAEMQNENQIYDSGSVTAFMGVSL